MNDRLIQKVSKEISRRFPEFDGKKPSIQKQPAPKSRGFSREPTYLLVYKTKMKTANDKWLPRILRVVVSENGNILKMTTSR